MGGFIKQVFATLFALLLFFFGGVFLLLIVASSGKKTVIPSGSTVQMTIDKLEPGSEQIRPEGRLWLIVNSVPKTPCSSSRTISSK